MPISLTGIVSVTDLGGRADIGLCDRVSPCPGGIERSDRRLPGYWSVRWEFLRAGGAGAGAITAAGLAGDLERAAAWLAGQAPGVFATLREAGAEMSVMFIARGTDGEEVHLSLPPELLRACGALSLPIAVSSVWADDL